MKTIKVKTPAKINLTLEILNKREDGYHNIESIMQAVRLYDFISITVQDNSNQENSIEISGNNPLIPYDKSNLAYISAEKFLNKSGIANKKINIYIEKNIPVAAGLAGGSSNAAGVLFGLNKLFNNILDTSQISVIASEIGADVNFCLHGGTQLATGKGENLKKLSTPDLNIIIVKPKNLFISAKEAYENYANINRKPKYIGSNSMINAISKNNPETISQLLNNDLEAGILEHYQEISKLKNKLKEIGCTNTLMSGSGPSVFGVYTGEIKYSELVNPEYNTFKVKTIACGTSL